MADEEALFHNLSVVVRSLKCLHSPWLEVKETLEKLKIWAKVRNNRCRLSEATVLHTKDIVVIFKDLLTLQTTEGGEKSVICSMEAVAEGLRFLRNCCAETATNQSSMVTLGLVKLTKDVITTLLKPEFQESETIAEPASVVVRSGLQLLGNIVVKNEETQQSIWDECFPHFFLSVMSSSDYSIQDCVCMVIYNCLNTHSRVQLVGNHCGFKILSHILHLCADSPQLEWGYFILEYLICNGLLPDMYEGIEFDPLSRLTWAQRDPTNITCTTESAQHKSSDYMLSPLSDDNITDAMDKPAEELKELNSSDGACHISLAYLAEKFENHAKDILHKLQELANSSDDIFQVLIFTRLLRLISTASGLHGNVTGLQGRLSLLEVCVGLLRETSKPEVRDIFSNVSSVPRGVDSGEVTPSHGFKRDLVQVIGNMCYRHTANQNKVRNLDGIPLILNHCNVDDHNPYICQWAIFALRNLLENNPENQNFVWWLDRQGLADTSRLRQFGVEAVEKDNGRIELIPLTPPKQQ